MTLRAPTTSRIAQPMQSTASVDTAKANNGAAKPIKKTTTGIPVSTNLKRKADALDNESTGMKATTKPIGKTPATASGPAGNGVASRLKRSTAGRDAVKPGTRTTRTTSIPAAKAKTTTATRSLAKENKDPAKSNIGGIRPLNKKPRTAIGTKSKLEEMKDKGAALKEQIRISTESIEQMTKQLESSETTVKELEQARISLQERMTAKEEENSAISAQLDNLKQELEKATRQHEQSIEELNTKHQDEITELKLKQDAIQKAHDSLAQELKRVEEQLAQEKEETARLNVTISSQSAAFLTLEGDYSALKAKLQRTEETLANRETTIEQLQNEVKDNKELIVALEQKIREEETMRRRLHNTIQELKGNIRVFCRVRPLLNGEAAKGKSTEENMPHMKLPSVMGGKEIELFQISESADGSKSVVKSYPFTFDNVFPVHVKQEQVFEEISQLVQSALDGYPVCIFAYGQTGSGKTYTMEGPNNPDSVSMGMIPRAVQQIFATAEKLKEKGWVYTMEGQFVEIYNETVHDLLGNGDLNKKHDIKHVAGNKTIITDVKTVMLDTPEKMTSLLKTASQNRAVGATLCNERSSRSHSVFTLRLSGRNTATEEVSEGVLNLIDLAGSERLSQSGATGDRLKETQAINKSLSSLGDVIAALSNNKDGHIPYRNSKLTYLLQNSLGGNSKTLMFVNISPSPESLQETLCSLRFATKVNACHIGTARRVAK